MNFKKRDLLKMDPGRISDELGKYRPVIHTRQITREIKNMAEARSGRTLDKPGSMEDSPWGNPSSQVHFQEHLWPVQAPHQPRAAPRLRPGLP